MSPSEEYAQVLLSKARDDLLVAERLALDSDMPQTIVGFHCHQAVEKSLKAVLAANEVEFRKTHALGYLGELLEGADLELPISGDELLYLAPLATEYRYDDPDEIDLDLTALVRLAREAVEWAGLQLSERAS